MTLRQKYLIDEGAGKPVPDWEPPEPPPELAHIWTWFCELDAGRHYHPDGRPEQISYQDIAAWAQLTGREVGPFELHLLRRLDHVFFDCKRNPKAVPKYLADQAPVPVEDQLKQALRMMSQLNKPATTKTDKTTGTKFLS